MARRSLRFLPHSSLRALVRTVVVAVVARCFLWSVEYRHPDAFAGSRQEDNRSTQAVARPAAWEPGRFAKTLSFFKGNPLKFFLPPFLQPKDPTAKRATLTAEGQSSSVIVDWGGSDGMPVSDTWGPLDDVVMGGVSSSRLLTEVGADGVRRLVFTGRTSRENNGGFCSFRSRLFSPPLDLSEYDGFAFTARCPDGLRYKMQLRDNDGWDSLGWAAGFDTSADGKEVEVRMPFDSLVANFRSRSQQTDKPFQKGSIRSIQFVLSAFEMDKEMNPRFKEGEFRLELGPLHGYKAGAE